MFDFFTVFMWTVFILAMMAIVGFALSVLQIQRMERSTVAARKTPERQGGVATKSASSGKAAPRKKSSSQAKQSKSSTTKRGTKSS